MTFAQWAAQVKSQGGAAVVWPFRDGVYGKYLGQPAARYDGPTLARLANSGAISTALPEQATPDNAWFYVLAPPDVVADAPHTMTVWDRTLNATLTTADKTAAALGLPSLAGLEHVILGVVGVAAALVVVWAIGQTKGWKNAL